MESEGSGPQQGRRRRASVSSVENVCAEEFGLQEESNNSWNGIVFAGVTELMLKSQKWKFARLKRQM